MRTDRLKHGVQIIRRLEASGVGDALNPDALFRFEMQCRWSEPHPVFDDGMIACPGGYFTLDPVFQAQGLRPLEHDGDAFIPSYNGLTEYEALASFFDIEPFQGEHIVGSNCTSLFDHEIERIRNVIDGLPESFLIEIRQSQWRQLELLKQQVVGDQDLHAYLLRERAA